jgi:hypothetical protein
VLSDKIKDCLDEDVEIVLMRERENEEEKGQE